MEARDRNMYVQRDETEETRSADLEQTPKDLRMDF